MSQKIYEMVNDKIIAQLEKGCVPWHRPWNYIENMPRNLISKREYRGINIWLLNSMSYPNQKPDKEYP